MSQGLDSLSFQGECFFHYSPNGELGSAHATPPMLHACGHLCDSLLEDNRCEIGNASLCRIGAFKSDDAIELTPPSQGNKTDIHSLLRPDSRSSFISGRKRTGISTITRHSPGSKPCKHVMTRTVVLVGFQQPTRKLVSANMWVSRCDKTVTTSSHL